LEISAIVIASSAGFVLGNSFMFPGTYTRLESFKIGAVESLKICVCLVPVFIVAGFLESFVTRYTEMPLWLSIGIIAVSGAFILLYFVVYPITYRHVHLTQLTKKTKYVSAATFHKGGL
jgi:uncharacterized membrane protein YhdT